MQDENPPAFPNTGNSTWQLEPTEGMTLRDWLAGQIAAAYCTATDSTGMWAAPADRAGARIVAERSYAIADAMLAHRQKGQSDADA